MNKWNHWIQKLMSVIKSFRSDCTCSLNLNLQTDVEMNPPQYQNALSKRNWTKRQITLYVVTCISFFYLIFISQTFFRISMFSVK